MSVLPGTATIAAVFLLSLTGCASLSTEVMIGAKTHDGGFYGPTGPLLTLRTRKHLTERTFCEYEHVSHLLVGPPLGPKSEEDSLNQVGCGIRFGGNY